MTRLAHWGSPVIPLCFGYFAVFAHVARDVLCPPCRDFNHHTKETNDD